MKVKTNRQNQSKEKGSLKNLNLEVNQRKNRLVLRKMAGEEEQHHHRRNQTRRKKQRNLLHLLREGDEAGVGQPLQRMHRGGQAAQGYNYLSKKKRKGRKKEEEARLRMYEEA